MYKKMEAECFKFEPVWFDAFLNKHATVHYQIMAAYGYFDAEARYYQRLPYKLKRNINVNKIKARSVLGWKEVYDELYNSPYCNKKKQLTRVTKCRKCFDAKCPKNGLSNSCYQEGEMHCIHPCEYPDLEFIETFTKYI